MDWNKKEIDAIESSRLDAILASDEELQPSSGFLSAVMERVQEEARMPAPIPFPWQRAIPGIVLAAGVFGWGAVEFVWLGIPAMKEFSVSALHFPPAAALPLQQAGWVALALGASAASWLLARRLAGRSWLL